MSPINRLLPPERWGSNVHLSQWEIRSYIVLCISAISYTIYSVYTASIVHREILNDNFLVDGWRIFDRQKDTSDFEWDFWSGWLFEVWPWFAGHLGLSLVFKTVNTKHRGHMFTIYVVIAHFHLLGWQTLTLFFCHVLIMYLMTFTRSKVIVWVASLSLLATLYLNVTVDIMQHMLHHDLYKKIYLRMCTLAMVNLRYTSAALEMCAQRAEIKELQRARTYEKKKLNAENSKYIKTHNYTFMDMIVYVFYLPLAITGPTITFDEFNVQVSSDTHLILPSLWTFLKRISRLAFWMLFIECSLHFLYFNCIKLDHDLLEELPLWTLAGIGYCQGQFFMVKYLVLFGFPSALAQVDGLETPEGPKCVSRIYLCSDMWKSFDRGLYGFLRKYIYIPLGGSKAGLPRQLLASLLCFSFVFLWHGPEDFLLVWVILNFIGVTIEAMSWKLSQYESVRQMEQAWLSAPTSRRLRAVAHIPLFIMSSIAMFTFFGGTHVGYIFYKKFILEGFQTANLTFFFYLYCGIQTAMEITLWENQRRLSQ